MMPSCSCPSASSRAEQSMPSEIAPRIFRFWSLRPPGSVTPDLGERIQLAGGDVRRAAHDVEQRARAGVHLGDVQVIGVRMRRFFDDARDDDLREVGAQRDQLVDRRDVRRDELAQLLWPTRRTGRTPATNRRRRSFAGSAPAAICSRNLTSES